MLKYPAIDPVAISIGPIAIHWYGLMYIFGIAIAWFLGRSRLPRVQPALSKDDLSDLVFYCALGVILGGRLGYVLFYDLPVYAENPLRIFQIWNGGMSFHGGMLGVIVGIWVFAKRRKRTFFSLADFVAPLAPIGLGLGRLGNFINGELLGKPTSPDHEWLGMIFPQDPMHLVRYPSQLYQCFLEGLVLFLIVWFFSRKPRPTMAVSGMFLLWYGIFRFVVEFVRLPDPQLGYLAFGWLTMGQVLCLPMIIIGLALLIVAYNKKSPIVNSNA
ncbi:prolipoprotein diacylglyceryl transferase [Gammaproteobacteria bacterium ESL0073]|nr:prolipoprotein diacylglyceryl transferase [Gammaproteobacteria bacterium ESL0073]